MIYTLTGNLLWESTLTFASWSPGATQRAQHVSEQVGGKGINVARMLTRLGRPVTALCFGGGASGRQCADWLDRRGIAHRMFPTSAATRVGFVVRAAQSPETTFLGADAPADGAALAACADFLATCPAGDMLAVCGSFPGWAEAEADALRHELARWAARGNLIVDTYGPPLRWFAEQPLELVKINRREFDELFAHSPGGEASSMEARLETACAAHPVRQWVITDGPGSVWVATAGSVPTVLQPPEVHEVSPTGSGDVLLACILDGLTAQGLDLVSAVEAALPFAAANAASEGIAEFDLNNPPCTRSVPS